MANEKQIHHSCPFFASVVDLDLHYDNHEIEATFIDALADTLNKALAAIKAETERQDKEQVFKPIRVRFRSNAEEDEGTVLYIAVGPGVRDLHIIEKHTGDHRCYRRDTGKQIALE